MNESVIEQRIGADVYVIRCGDDHASIWWAGESWSIHEEDALVVPEWQDAKRLMAELRDSHGSTIRTEAATCGSGAVVETYQGSAVYPSKVLCDQARDHTGPHAGRLGPLVRWKDGARGPIIVPAANAGN